MELVCRRCGRPVKRFAKDYDLFEGMHWICFHLEFEHGDHDPDEACDDPGCPWQWARAIQPEASGERFKGPYTVGIEAEHWEPGEWDPSNDNTDVSVTFADGAQWAATFFTYANIARLTEKNRRTGECMSGAYFWAKDMLLVDEVTRERIEAVVAQLLSEGTFPDIFSPCITVPKGAC